MLFAVNRGTDRFTLAFVTRSGKRSEWGYPALSMVWLTATARYTNHEQPFILSLPSGHKEWGAQT